ncbi:hypothetical protein IPM62_02005 [Candidatus Woesebacteria bacterium]|nr:MAG: hypothetical protein IPM62_02005 [Candidatus Woesebacteria bacterium]
MNKMQRSTKLIIAIFLAFLIWNISPSRVNAQACSGSGSTSYTKYKCTRNMANAWTCVDDGTVTNSGGCSWIQTGVCGWNEANEPRCVDGTTTNYCTMSNQCAGFNQCITTAGCSVGPVPTLPPGVTPVPTVPSGGSGCGTSCSSDQQCPAQPSKLCVGAPNGTCFCDDGGTPITGCGGITFAPGYSEEDFYGSDPVRMIVRDAGNNNMWDAGVSIVSYSTNQPSPFSTSCEPWPGGPGTEPGARYDRYCNINPAQLQPLNPGDYIHMSATIEFSPADDTDECPNDFQMPYNGTIIGRVYNDDNGNSVLDDTLGEGYIVNRAFSTCTGAKKYLDGLFVQAVNTITGQIYTVKVNEDGAGGELCNPEPLYQFSGLPDGIYNVSIKTDSLPVGWGAPVALPPGPGCVNSGLGTVNCTVASGSISHAWFTVKQVSCQLTLSSPLNISIGGMANITTSSLIQTNGDIDRIQYMVDDASIADFNSDSGTYVDQFTDSNKADGFSATLYGNAIGVSNISAFGAMLDEGNIMCTPNPASATVNVTNPSAWWQSIGGSIMAKGNILSIISPTTCTLPACNPVLITDGASIPGIAVSTNTINPNPPNVSSHNRQVENTFLASDEYNYAFFENRLSGEIKSGRTIVTNTVAANGLNSGALINGYRWLYSDGPLSIDGVQNLGDNKVVLFVNGNLTLREKINFNDGSGFFMAVVNGNIVIDTAFAGAASEPELEGIFYAEGNFNTDATLGTLDEQLLVRGTVVANTFSLNRELSINTFTPAEVFEFAPDVIINYPRNLRVKQVTWREVAP